MKLVLKIIGLLLALWIFYTVTIRCEGTIPYCIGWSFNTTVTDVYEGLFQDVRQRQ
jgi:hypothetical protein